MTTEPDSEPARTPGAAPAAPGRPGVLALAVAVLVPAAATRLVLDLPGSAAAFRDPPDAWLLAPQAWRGLGGEHLRWMLETTRGGVHQPLAWLSFALTDTAAGTSPGAHRAVQVALVAAAAAALGALVLAMLRASGAAAVWRRSAALAAALAAAAWGVHPLRIEPAATLAARGDVVATALGLAAAACFVAAVARPRLGRGALAAAMAGSLLAALASPLSAAFVVAFWALGRWVARAAPASRAARAPLTWPLAVVSLPPILSLVGAAAVRPPDAATPGLASLAALGHALVAPLWDTVWPAGLHPFHDAPPGWPGEVPAAWWVQTAIAALLAGWALLGARRGRGAPLALLASFVAAAVAWALGREAGGSDVGALAATAPLYVALGAWIGDGAGCCLAFLGAPLVAAMVALPAWATHRTLPDWASDAAVAARVLAIDPTNDVVRGALGDAARRRKSPAEAEAHFRRALEAGGRRPWAEAGLGTLALDRGDVAVAAEHLERATADAPWIPGPWIDLGAARLQQGRPADAVTALEAAVRLDAENAGAWFALGRARATQGDRFAAAEAFRRAVALDPEDGRAREELKRLDAK